MKYLMFMLMPLALVVTALADPALQDAKNSQGTWLPTRAELGGKPMQDDFLTNTVLKLVQGNYEVTVRGLPDKGAYTLDAGSKPKTLDITGSEGPNAGKKILCIYELKGNTLKICYGLDGSARPTEFKSPPATKYFLVTYERKKS